MKRLLAASLAAGLVVATSAAAFAAPAKRRATLPAGVSVAFTTHNAHIVSIDPKAHVRLSTVIAGTHLTDRQTVQDLCRKTANCVVAINGDFFGPSDPLGPVVVNQRLLRSGSSGHGAITVQPTPAPGVTGQLKVALDLPVVGHLDLPVNVGPGAGMSLYTPLTPSITLRKGQVALLLRVSGRGAQVATLGSTGTVEPKKLVTRGTVTLGQGTAVILASARQASKLKTWWSIRKHGGHITYPTTAAKDVIGGFPQLIRNGRLTFDLRHPPDDGLHARTAIGGDDKGHVWMLVIDQPVHISIPAKMLLDRGATWAMNLDGGGSSTLATRSKVLSSPKHGQRKVASALVIVYDPHATISAPITVKRAPAPSPSPAPVPAPVVVPILPLPSPSPSPHRILPTRIGPIPLAHTTTSATTRKMHGAVSLAVVVLAFVAGGVTIQLRMRRR